MQVIFLLYLSNAPKLLNLVEEVEELHDIFSLQLTFVSAKMVLWKCIGARIAIILLKQVTKLKLWNISNGIYIKDTKAIVSTARDLSTNTERSMVKLNATIIAYQLKK